MSIRSFLASWRLVAGALTGTAVLVACTIEAPAPAKRKPADFEYPPMLDAPAREAPLEPDLINEGEFAQRPGGNPISQRDAGPKTYCGDSVGPGDLAIVELMIASKNGAADSGEWVEIQNTRECWLKLKGVSIASPRGAAEDVAKFEGDFDLAPGGTFVVADTSDSAKNHGLAGKVIAWNATDVLDDGGDTLYVRLGDTPIDKLTFPYFSNLVPGRAISFPIDCAWTDRADWGRWSLTFNAYAPNLQGTPNQPNADITCF